MRRPSNMDFALGNRLARVSILGASVYLLYLTAQAQISGVWALFGLALLLARHAGRASARVRAYRAWTASWQKMTGSSSTPANDNSRGLTRRAVRRIVAVGTWALFGLWLLGSPQQAGTSNYTTIAVGFCTLTVWGAAVVLLPFARRRRGEKKQRKAPAEPFTVKVVPPVAKSSPSIARITQRLPDYCKDLMARRSATA